MTLTKAQARAIIALAENRLRPGRAAKATHYRPCTFEAHIQRILKNTGKDPRDFYDMCELLPEAKKVLEDEL